MSVPRIGRRPLVSVAAAAEPAPAMPLIAINCKRGAVVECPTNQDLVSDILHATPRLRRGQRKDGYMHVSDLIGKGKCVRKVAMAEKFGAGIRPMRLSIFDRLAFAIGDAIHDLTKKVASEGAPHRVWGLWKCSCGHLYHDEPCTLAEIDPDDVCPLCNTAADVYKEVPVFNDEYNIVGNPDLLMYIAEVRAFHVTEIKSMSQEQWAELVRPLPEHVLQVVFYWWLMMEAGYRLTSRVSIIYITKNYQFKGNADKEFMIDPREELHRLLPYLSDAMRAKMSKTSNIFPIRKVCSGEFATLARKCEVVTQCFATEDKP